MHLNASNSQNAQSQKLANFLEQQGNEAMKFDVREFDNSTNSRLITKMSDRGTGALSPDDLNEVTHFLVRLKWNYKERMSV